MPTPAQLAPPWMPPALIKAWYDEYLLAGGASVSNASRVAADIIRHESQYRALYDKFFPGNRREDGSLRLEEGAYKRRLDAYEQALLAVRVNPQRFRGKFAGLIEGDVTASEFTGRVEDMFERVIEGAPTIRDFYARHYALNMTDSAIVASFLDPEIGQAILDRRISISEIGGEADVRGFEVTRGFAERLLTAGLSGSASQDFFGTAAMEVPMLNVLAARHIDPDDDFDLQEFTQAAIFDDPEQRRRMRRLMAQENASWNTTPAGTGFVEDRETGGLAGMAVR